MTFDMTGEGKNKRNKNIIPSIPHDGQTNQGITAYSILFAMVVTSKRKKGKAEGGGFRSITSTNVKQIQLSFRH